MKHILVVDDEPRIAQIARDYLERAGFAVTVAANGADAVAFARSRHPDLIVLDLGLPCMDGLDVTRALCSSSPSLAPLPRSPRWSAFCGASAFRWPE